MARLFRYNGTEGSWLAQNLLRALAGNFELAFITLVAAGSLLAHDESIAIRLRVELLEGQEAY